MFVELILVLLVVFVYVLKKRKDEEGLPPGDWSWPILGTIILSSESFASMIASQAKKHGSIFRMRIGHINAVFLTDYESIKTAFMQPQLSARPQTASFRMFSNKGRGGIVFSSGQIWQSNRKFAIRHLKGLGMGKQSLESTISHEISHVLAHFQQNVAKPMNIEEHLNIGILNIIWTITADRRYDIDDKELLEFMSSIIFLDSAVQGPFALLDIYPVLNTILPDLIKNKWMKVDQLEKMVEKIITFLKSIVDEHVDTLDESQPRDLIDLYLMEIDADTYRQRGDSFETELNNLTTIIWDMFTAGSETLSTTIRWLILYMAKYPHVQANIQAELDEVVGQARRPCLEDRSKLPYLEASIMELMRNVSLAPKGLPHYAQNDTMLYGYKIPKGSSVIACLEECHQNPKYWEKPGEFFPEHFMENGKLISQKEGYVPFLVGRRVCLGESLAKMELFLFTSAILNEFVIKAPVNSALLDITPHRAQSLNHPKPFQIVLEKRVK